MEKREKPNEFDIHEVLWRFINNRLWFNVYLIAIFVITVWHGISNGFSWVDFIVIAAILFSLFYELWKWGKEKEFY